MMKKNSTHKQIRVRIAPSPTGLLHFGTARSALYNYLFARQNNGEFILRIEDTDRKRSKKEYEEDIVSGLEWLGLGWDEGPVRQSERASIYQKHLNGLLNSKAAFWCEHSKEELEKERKRQMKKGEAPRHVCSHRQDPKVQKRKKGIVRIHSPSKKIVFNDLIRGKIEFDAELLGDISIARKEGKEPLYNFVVVVDDYEMKISHVIRGEDHLSNTPKQILIYQALGFDVPQFGHLPMVLNPDRSKMSKRHNLVSLTAYRKAGYLPESMVNFMALLGWNPGGEQEIFSLEELIKKFSLDRVHKGGAVFDIKRLDWLNGRYIRAMDLGNLAEQCIPYLKSSGLLHSARNDRFEIVATGEKVSFDYLKKIVALEQERLKKLSDIGDLTKFFFIDEPKYKSSLLIWKKMTKKEIRENLKLLRDVVAEADPFDKKSLENIIMPLAKEQGIGELLWPLRVALTGQKASPGPFEVMEVLGKKKTLSRIDRALKILA